MRQSVLAKRLRARLDGGGSRSRLPRNKSDKDYQGRRLLLQVAISKKKERAKSEANAPAYTLSPPGALDRTNETNHVIA